MSRDKVMTKISGRRNPKGRSNPTRSTPAQVHVPPLMTSRIPLSRKVVCAAKRRRLSTPEAPHETRGMKLNRLSHALGAFMTAKNGSRQEQAGTDPAGSPQPGAGNAGDQDHLRKSTA